MDFEIYQNRHHDIEFTYKEDDVAQDISAAELTFSVYTAKDATASFTKQNTAAGGSDAEISWVTDGTDGKFYVHVLPANTSGLTPRNYWYEIKMTLSSKDTTIGLGQFKLIETMIA